LGRFGDGDSFPAQLDGFGSSTGNELARLFEDFRGRNVIVLFVQRFRGGKHGFVVGKVPAMDSGLACS